MARRRQPRAWARARASRSVCGRRTAAAAATRLQTPVGGLTAHLRRRLRRATRGLRSAARQVRAAVASGRAGPRSLARRPGAAAEKEKGGGRTTVTRVEVGGKGIKPYPLGAVPTLSSTRARLCLQRPGARPLESASKDLLSGLVRECRLYTSLECLAGEGAARRKLVAPFSPIPCGIYNVNSYGEDLVPLGVSPLSSRRLSASLLEASPGTLLS